MIRRKDPATFRSATLSHCNISPCHISPCNISPRPPLPGEVETYTDASLRRFLVKPGITGLSQISGRENLAWEDAVRLDLSYVENWSLAGDVAIVIKSAKAALLGRAAR